MKNYDIIAIGSGTASNLIKKLLQKDKKLKIAMIEKDDLGGICILRGCVPSKLLLHPADFIRMLERGADFGVEVAQKKVDFKKIMNRMRKLVQLLVENKKEFLLNHSQIDYYNGIAEFVEPYVVKVNDVIMKGKKIFLTLGSEPSIPPIKGLDEINFHTNKTILSINEPPDSLVFIGGGFIAAEYGHFFSSMGSNVTIIGRNRQFLPQEEIEISKMAKNELRKNMEIYTNHEVVEVKRGKDSKK